MNISFVIPNYNGEKLLQKNLPKLVDILKIYKSGKVEVIVPDDSSKDNSLKFLKEFIANNKSSVAILVIENNSGKNKGFSANVNKGVAAAKGEIVVLFNTDITPRKDFLEPLLQHFKNEDVFAVGCMDESIENGRSVLRGRGIGRWQRGFLVHKAGDINAGSSTLWVSGGSGAFRKSLWERLGGLNDLYNPFYWEDIDLSYRAQKAGFTVLFEKKSVVKHEHEEGSIKKNYSSFSVKKTAYRNQFFFTWLNATDTILFVQHIIFLPVFLYKSLTQKDMAFFVGFGNALLQLPRVLKERARIQRLVKKSDKEVVSQFTKEL